MRNLSNIIDNVSLKEVCLPDYIQIDNQKYRVTAIAASSFSGCRELETITIPKTIEKIEWNMLYLERLCQIKVDEANLFFKDINGVLYTKDGKTIIAYPNKHSSEYEICSGTVTISHFTFKGCSNLQKVIIPLSVRFIGNNAFYRCVNLKKVYIHDLILIMKNIMNLKLSIGSILLIPSMRFSNGLSIRHKIWI